jgi:hypothetical protein
MNAMLPFAVIAIAFWGTVLGGGVYFARRFARIAEMRGGDAMQLSQLSDRIGALEEALDGAQRNIERLETGQDFTARLLESRPALPTSSSRG